MQEVSVDGVGGVRLAVRTWSGGADVPMLLVHGLASNARLWDGVADALAGLGHPVAAVDQRGHGRSDKPDVGYDYATLSADLSAVIDGLGWQRPAVAGQSWGANVVLELAARHPEAVRGVACVDGGTIELSRHFESWEACAAALAPPRLDGRPFADIEAGVRAMHPDWPESGITGILGCFDVGADGTVRPYLTFDRHLRILREMWAQHPPELYPRLTVPVLLVPAQDDSPWIDAKRQSVAEAEKTIAAVRVRWVEGDHDLHAQHPDVIAQLLHDAVHDGFFA